MKVLLNRKDMSVQDLAELLGQSRQNINTKLKKENFSEQDLRKISNVLEVEFEGFFFLKNGDKI
ncbi:helix-turn-helix domain-containing protein [Lysinibacillus sp. FJAT-14745]|uniref:helix-turn-helix domain-containing protein n=1 Tax=Lysinibacillus sp. FJAT-14745 TaxID=1704289 RepID=UPI0035124996